MLNLDDEQYIRCVNCWLLHTNNKSILDHWNNGGCLFYCSICGKSFHDNIKELKPHFENEHGIKYRAAFIPQMIQTKKIEPMKKIESPKKPAIEQKINTNIMEQNSMEFDEYNCEPCGRTFKNIKAYRTHYTIIHKKKNWSLNPLPGAGGVSHETVDDAVNPIAVINELTKLNKNQKKCGKKWKKRTNEAVMKTIIRKPPKQSHITQKKVKPLAEPIETTQVETLVQCSTSRIVDAVEEAAEEEISTDMLVSQDQTISSTYLSTSITNHMDDIQIKPEPEQIQELTNNYPDIPVQSCNGWVHLPQQNQYDEWNQNIIDPFIDTSPRLKVKDLTDLQGPKQYPIESQTYQQNNMYIEPQVIVPNRNMSGIQIQNVQSYQTHTVQPQPYTDYSCVNSMNQSMNMPDHGVCTSNLYGMHMSQAPPVQNTQLINPVFYLPNSPHTVPEYHY